MNQDPQIKNRLARKPAKVEVRVMVPAKHDVEAGFLVGKRPMVLGWGIPFEVEQQIYDRLVRFAKGPGLFQSMHMRLSVGGTVPYTGSDREEVVMRVADRLIQRWRKAGVIVKGPTRSNWVLTALVPTP